MAHGEVVESERLFLPMDRHVLLGRRAPDFDIYCSNVGQRALERILVAGEEVPGAMIDWLSQESFGQVLYVRGDQRDQLLAFEQQRLDEILEDTSAPVTSKCNILRDVTSMLSMIVFETPTAQAIQRQRSHITRMIDFSMKSPEAVSHMLRLTHHDYHTYTHSVNVGIYGLAIAMELLKSNGEHDLNEITAGFFLHDLGKCRVPSEIINKPGPLSSDEWTIMRGHPMYGYRLLNREGALSKEVSIIVRQHHERMDGTGYPEKLIGDRIHLYARICAVADAFDALTTHRSYKAPMTSFHALQTMKEEMEAQFDPDIFRTLVLLLKGETS